MSIRFFIFRFFAGLWILLSGPFAFSQWKPEDYTPQKEQALLQAVANKRTDTSYVKTLLQASTFYLYKAGEDTTDLNKALRYASQARILSLQLHYTPGIDKATLLEAIQYGERNDAVRLKSYLNLTTDTARLNIIVAIYHYHYYKSWSVSSFDSCFKYLELGKAYAEGLKDGKWQYYFSNEIGKLRSDPTYQQEAKLLQAIQRKRTDTSYVNALLQLSEFHLFKAHTDTIDVAKAWKYTTAARELSAQLKYDNGIETARSYQVLYFVLRGDLAQAKARITSLNSPGRLSSIFYIYDHYKRNIDHPGYRDSALKYLEWGRLQAIRQRDVFNESDYTATIVDLKFPTNKLEAARECERYIARNIANGHPIQHSIHIRAAGYYFRLEFYNLAIAHCQKALDLLQKYPDEGTAASCYMLMANIYHNLKQYENSLLYNRLSLKINKKLHDPMMIYYHLENICLELYYLNKPDQAYTELNTLFAEYPPSTDYGKFVMHQLYGDYYSRTNQLDQAGKHFALMQTVDKNINRPRFVTSHYMLGCFYLRTGAYEKAKALFDTIISSKANPDFLISNRYLSNVYLQLYKLDSSLGNHAQAVASLKKFKELSDSTMENTRIRQFQELEIQYDSEKKSRDLRLKEQDLLLVTRQAELQQKDFEQERLRFDFETREKEQNLKMIQLQADEKGKDLLVQQQRLALLQKDSQLTASTLLQTRSTRNMLIGGILMVLLLALLIYNRYRIKQKSHTQLLAQQALISQHNETLQHMVQEKEWLLQEVHHRVKNNLQTVLSLLETQSRYLSNEALHALKDSQHRVYAMSLIHRKLYQSEEVSSIHMKEYLEELVTYLKDSMTGPASIAFNLQVEAISLDVSQAVPVGLIVNEAVTNAMKYAFLPGYPQPSILVAFKRVDDQAVCLTVSDNGTGLANKPGFSGKKGGMGMKLMEGLAEDIDGHYSVSSGPGTTISIRFIPNALLGKQG